MSISSTIQSFSLPQPTFKLAELAYSKPTGLQCIVSGYGRLLGVLGHPRHVDDGIVKGQGAVAVVRDGIAGHETGGVLQRVADGRVAGVVTRASFYSSHLWQAAAQPQPRFLERFAHSALDQGLAQLQAPAWEAPRPCLMVVHRAELKRWTDILAAHVAL